MQIICKQDKILYMNENMARDILKKKGLAATKQRVAIFLKICECSCHFTAGELHHLLAEKEDEETLSLIHISLTGGMPSLLMTWWTLARPPKS